MVRAKIMTAEEAKAVALEVKKVSYIQAELRRKDMTKLIGDHILERSKEGKTSGEFLVQYKFIEDIDTVVKEFRQVGYKIDVTYPPIPRCPNFENSLVLEATLRIEWGV